ncbi:MAG: glycosyltransferase family 39 protein, partial [Nitrospinota bacterium]|nr:glycosyltransferase family 39 protein [Nitrospinota bacterium]
MSASPFRKWAWRSLAAVVTLYSLILLVYFIVGGLDFTLPLAGRIYLNDWLKPYQIILASLLLMVALYAIPPGASEALRPYLAGAAQWAARRQHGLLLALIVVIAMALRLWSLGHGITQYIFWIDAPQYIIAAQEYLKGNYSLETGYPFFASHFVEWSLLAVNGALAYMGFFPLPPESNTLAMIARSLNMGYVIGMMASIYLIGVAAGLRTAGVFGMFLLAVSTINVQMSHYFINDMAMSFFSLLAVAAAAQNLNGERLRWYLLFGALASLSFTCKYNGILSFVFLGFIYYQLHRDWRGFIANLDKPVKAILVFISLYILITPTVWTKPLEKMQLTWRMAGLISLPRGVHLEQSTGLTMLDHAAMLFADWPYHLWVMEGLFHPLPLWLG